MNWNASVGFRTLRNHRAKAPDETKKTVGCLFFPLKLSSLEEVQEFKLVLLG